MNRASAFILERVSQPAIEAVTLAELKLHLRTYASDTAEDDLLSALIVVAREWVEDYTGRVLVDSTWRLTIGDFVAGFANVDSDTVTGYYRGPWFPRADLGIELRRAPALAITSFVTVATDGTETAVDAATYELREADSKWPRVYPLAGATWGAGPMRITFRAGFADQTGSPTTGAEVVPERFKQAMKLYAEALYDRDEKAMPMLMNAAEALIRPERANLQIA